MVERCEVCHAVVNGGPGSMATHRKLNTTCRLITKSSPSPFRPQQTGNKKTESEQQGIAAEICRIGDDECLYLADSDIETCCFHEEFEPLPVLAPPDMSLGIRERAYARFKIAVERSRIGPVAKVLFSDGQEVHETDTVIDDETTGADEEGGLATEEEPGVKSYIASPSLNNFRGSDRGSPCSNRDSPCPKLAGSPCPTTDRPCSRNNCPSADNECHKPSACHTPNSDNQSDKNEELSKLRSGLVNLCCPADGQAGLTHDQRAKTLELVEVALQAGGGAWTIKDVVETAPSKSDNMELIFLHYIESLTDGDGWVSKKFEVTGGTATARWNANVIANLSSTVATMYHQLVRVPTWDGCRFGHPSSGSYMKEFYNLIRSQRNFIGDWDEERDFPLLLTYFSDATLLANRGSLSAHPVVVGIGNLPSSLYPSSLVTVGYLDTSIQFDGDLNPPARRRVKRQLIAMQVFAMMEQFVRASYEGCEVDIPTLASDDHRAKVRYFPGLFDAALDYPEVVSMLGIKSGYCGMCYWKTDAGTPCCFEMSDFRQGTNSPRTEKRSRETHDEMRATKRRVEMKALVDKYGAHPQQPGALWGFNGSCPVENIPTCVPLDTRIRIEHWAIYDTLINPAADRRALDLHIVVSQETMHEIDLGLTCYLRRAVLELLRTDHGMTNELIEEKVNQPLLKCLTQESRWQGLFHPPLTRETNSILGYFGGCSKVQASEHRSVLQVLVPVLCRALGFRDTITRLVALYLKYYTTRERRLTPEKYHTEESLAETERLFYKLHRRLLQLQPGGRTSYNQPKIHAQVHFAERVRRAGHSLITTGEAGESLNAKVKAPYKGGRTNRQTSRVADQLVRHRRQAEAAQRLNTLALRSAVLPSSGAEGIKYETSFVLATKTDSVAFTKHSNVRGADIFDTDQLQHFVDTCRVRWNNSIGRTKSELMCNADKPEVLKDMTGQHQYFMKTFGDTVIAERFLSELAWWATKERDYSDVLDPCSMLLRTKVVRNAVSASVWQGQDRLESQHRLLQRLRCDPSFRSRDADKEMAMGNDFVAIRGQSEHLGEHLWYARIILMFHLQCPSSREWLQYAFVRYMTRVEHKDDESKRFASSDDEPRVTCLRYATRKINNQEVWYYGLLLVECIERKVQVIAGNDQASLSLSSSRGEPQYYQQDKAAKFLLNHYVWQSQANHAYTLG